MIDEKRKKEYFYLECNDALPSKGLVHRTFHDTLAWLEMYNKEVFDNLILVFRTVPYKDSLIKKLSNKKGSRPLLFDFDNFIHFDFNQLIKENNN